MKNIKAWIFDWDGIFNDGHKGHDGSNTFCERDSMATNMMRFAHYLRHDEIPFTAIVTGATNPTPKFFAKREHFNNIVPGALYKRDVVQILLNEWGIAPHEAAFVFDDVLDLNVAEIVGLRLQVRYQSSPYLNGFIDEHKLADISTSLSGRDQAVRILLEYCISSLGLINETTLARMHVNETYQTYFNKRQSIETKISTRAEMLAE